MLHSSSHSFQVPFFLFIIITVYTMLPFQLGYAVILSIISILSHIIVLSVYLTVGGLPPKLTSHHITNQVKENLVSDWLKGKHVFSFSKPVCKEAEKDVTPQC